MSRLGPLNFTKQGTYSVIAGAVCLAAAALLVLYILQESSSVSRLNPYTGPSTSARDKNSSNKTNVWVDPRAYNTARNLYARATTPREQAYAAEALRIADDEVKQNFDLNTRELDLNPPTFNAEQQQLADRAAHLQKQLEEDAAELSRLTSHKSNRTSTAADLSERLDALNAQKALDDIDLEDARLDLDRAGGSLDNKIKREREQYNALEQTPPQEPVDSLETASSLRSLRGQIQAFVFLSELDRSLKNALAESRSAATTLEQQHNGIENRIPPVVSSSGPRAASTFSAAVIREAKTKNILVDLDRRDVDFEKLAGIYTDWEALASLRRNSVGLMILATFALILAVLVAARVVAVWGRKVFPDIRDDRTRLRHVRVPIALFVQIVGAVIVFVIVFGQPAQISTMIGLFGAGLAVVMKDFIVAFCGSFVLMGKNGMRKRDWVEIEGVTGEVIEIGMLRTVLLEAGNWTDSGHPTGRKVAIVNSFAIEGHYFNFTTSGQWLWDELHVTVPSPDKVHDVMDDIRSKAAELTKADAETARAEWEFATRDYGPVDFPAVSSVYLRPDSSGLQIVVRYITHASERYERRAQMTKLILDTLYQKRVPADQASITTDAPLVTGAATA